MYDDSRCYIRMTSELPWHVEIKAWAERSSWRYSLIPLSVRRSIPMFWRAGIPAAICRDPSPLLAEARLLIARWDELDRASARDRTGQGRWWNDDLRIAVNHALETGMASLANAYGRDSTVSLVEWIRRNEADRQQHDKWRAYWLFFQDVARNRVMLDPALSDVTHIIRATLSEAFTAALRQDERQASLIELSAAERSLLTLEPSLDEPSPGEIDVVAHLALAARREAARRLHELLRVTMPIDQWEAMADALMRFGV